MQNDLDDILFVATGAVAKGAIVHHAGFKLSLLPQTKSSEMDLVTEIDFETEQVIISYILERRQNDTIISEEGNNHFGNSGVCWIIDPLDGTVNYLHRYPAFGISAGVEINGIGTVGVIHDTYYNNIYSAIIDKKAMCNGETVSVSACISLKNALVATGFLPNPGIRRYQGRILSEILPYVRDIRRSGSPIIDFCRIASGNLDGFYEFGLRKWDIAAGSIIARTAGAKVTILPSMDELNPLVVASAPKIHDELLELT
jgi:myo-inositol-1(or 4)-monophosphatase